MQGKELRGLRTVFYGLRLGNLRYLGQRTSFQTEPNCQNAKIQQNRHPPSWSTKSTLVGKSHVNLNSAAKPVNRQPVRFWSAQNRRCVRLPAGHQWYNLELMPDIARLSGLHMSQIFSTGESHCKKERSRVCLGILMDQSDWPSGPKPAGPLGRFIKVLQCPGSSIEVVDLWISRYNHCASSQLFDAAWLKCPTFLQDQRLFLIDQMQLHALTFSLAPPSTSSTPGTMVKGIVK